MSVMTLVPTPRTAPDACADDDRGLLDALAAGDEATWQATVRRYEGLLRSAARVVLRSDADIDEAVQRTWVLLFRNADRINDAAGACRAGCRRPPAARRWRSCAVSSARSRARTSPTTSPPTRPTSPRRSWTTSCAGRWTRRSRRLPPSQRLIVRALLREPASYDALSAGTRASRGAASARCAAAPCGPCAPSWSRACAERGC